MKLSKGNRNICIQKLNNEQREMLGENRAVAYNYKWLLRRQLRTKTCIRIDECVVAVVFIQNTPMIWWVDICCLNDNWAMKKEGMSCGYMVLYNLFEYAALFSSTVLVLYYYFIKKIKWFDNGKVLMRYAYDLLCFDWCLTFHHRYKP